MANPKRYFHDKLVLVLISSMGFFVLLSTINILLKLGNNSTGGFIAHYRSSLGLAAFKPGGVGEFIAFIIFGFLVFGLHLFVSLNLYSVRRFMSVSVLVLGVLLLVLSSVVSNALLELL